MNDQAENLRNMVAESKETKKEKNTKVITVTSGKGGVGKTNVSVNLALALKEQGFNVVVIDADLGLSNIEIIFDVHPKYTLQDVISGAKTVNDILEDGPLGVKFISAGSGIEELANLDVEALDNVIDKLSVLDDIADFVIVDTGAGMGKNVLKFVLSADEVIMVTTPEPTAITDAYGFLKVLSTKRMKKPINLLINQSHNAKQAQELLNKFIDLLAKFLDVSARPLGYILDDKQLQRAVMMQTPVLISFPNSTFSKQIRQISKQFSLNDIEVENTGIREFLKSLKKYFR